MAGGSATTGRKNVDVSNIFFINMLSKAFAAVIILFLIVPKGKPDKPISDSINKGIVDCGNFNAYLKANETKIPKDVLEKLKQFQSDFEKNFKDLREQVAVLTAERDRWQRRALAAEDSLKKYKCPPGQFWDAKKNACVEDRTCPEGYRFDNATNDCIKICPPGYTYDPVKKDCIKSGGGGGTTPQCDGGRTYNPNTKQCECPEGTTWNEESKKCEGNNSPCTITDPFAVVAVWDNRDDEVDLYVGKAGAGKNGLSFEGGPNVGELQWKRNGRSGERVKKSNIDDGEYDVYIHYYKKNGRRTATTDLVSVELSWGISPQNINKDVKKPRKGDPPPAPVDPSLKKSCGSLGKFNLPGGFREPLKDNGISKLGVISIKGGKFEKWTPSAKF